MKVSSNLSAKTNNTANNHLKQMILDYQGIKIHSVELIEEVEEVVKPEATLLQILNIYNEDDLDQSLVQLFSEESI
mgnify:CR=1 FL=1|tara:strand:- start:448 stop:675 length:228 start_codon:yes stop_codon:yes gene_type:complete